MFCNQLRYPGDFSFKDTVLSSCFPFVVEYALPFVLGSFTSAVGRLFFCLTVQFLFCLVPLSNFYLSSYYSVSISLHRPLFCSVSKSNVVLSHYSGSVCQSQWPRGLRRWSAAARLLRLWVLIPPGAWMFVCCECLSG